MKKTIASLLLLLSSTNSFAIGSATPQVFANTIKNSGGGSVVTNATGAMTVPSATDTLVGKNTTDTLTNKTLNGNTATNLISGAGTITHNTSGTITVPNGTDTLVGKNTTDTLTNKTAAVGSNHITSTAARAAQYNSGSGDLEPSTVTTTELGYVSGVTSAIQTQLNSVTGAASQSASLSNLGLSATISSNTLVIAVKQADGSTDCTGGNPCAIAFRNATATTGSYSTVNITAAASVTVGTTDSLGVAAAAGAGVYVYYISDGTSEPCVSSLKFDEGTVQSATAFTGGAETSASTLYCANAHTSRPIRFLGRVTATWGNPNWSSITEVSLTPARVNRNPDVQAFYTGSSATYTLPVGAKSLDIWFCGAGAGGGGAGGSPTTGSAPTGPTTVVSGGTTIISCAAPAGGTAAGVGGAGAGCTLTAPFVGVNFVTGATGGPTPCNTAGCGGGQGGQSLWGGAGIGGVSTVQSAGNAGGGTGSGGGGAFLAAASGAGGGGAGGCGWGVLQNPPATLTYSVPAGGAHGTGTNAGGDGGGGFVSFVARF